MKRLVYDENKKNTSRGLVLTEAQLEKFRKCIKMENKKCNVSEIVRELVLNFIDEIENSNNIDSVILKYTGKDNYSKKELKVTGFRIDHETFKIFSFYCLCTGNDTSEMLRKLVLEYINEPISKYTLANLKQKLNKN